MDFLEHVRAAISEHALLQPGDTVIAGVSGGPDSLALLHALVSLRQELQIQIHVAHLDHRLRGADSEADAAYVAGLAHDWGLAATVEGLDVAEYGRQHGLAIEEAARQARYNFLSRVAQRVGARVVAVAHNADDQVETVLMHFLRGAGMAGLGGMRYRVTLQNGQISLVRPLLEITRKEIEAYCAENHLQPRFDWSNLDTTFFRNRLRHEVLPYLEGTNPNLRDVLRHTAHVLADDYDFLQGQVQATYAQVAREQDGTVILARREWRALAPALQRGVLRLAIRRLRSDLRNVDWRHVENARLVALEKETGAAATLPRGLALAIDYDRLIIGDRERVQTAPPAQDLPQLGVEWMELELDRSLPIPGSDWQVLAALASGGHVPTRWTARLDFEKCRGILALRRRRPGDRFQPFGLKGHSKSVRKFMIDEKVPRTARERLPILVADERILWICGWQVDERASVTSDTHRVLQVTLLQKGAGALS